jgi:hypothetical protein
MTIRLFLAALAFGAVLLCSSGAWADMPQGRIKSDLTVGANRDVRLRAGDIVQVMSNSGGKVVVMSTLPDGSNGVFEINAADVEMIAASPSPAPAPAPAAAPPATAQTTTAPVVPAGNTEAKIEATTANAPRVSTAPAAPLGPPTYPDDFVGSATVSTTEGERSAGAASIVKLKGGTQTYILSARHLLGPEGGFSKQTPADKVPELVQGISIDAFAGGRSRYDVTALLVPSKRLNPIGGEPMDDAAIYVNHDTTPQSQAVALATEVPPVGSTVWIVARVRGGVPDGQILQSGKVAFNTRWIEIQFDNDGIDTAGASGAPALNAAGEVVGVYSGHLDKNGHRMGFIIPSTQIQKIITAANP